MQSPIGLVAALRPSTRSDLLVATAFSSLVFTATPFLVPAVADGYDVGLGAASLISSAQLAGFVLASWIGGRVLRPSKRVLVLAMAAAVISHALSAAVPWYSGLLGLRVLSGTALGIVGWLGWQEVFGDKDRMGDLAVVGPVMGIAGAPLASFLAEEWGADGVFLTMSLLALIPLAGAYRSSTPLGPRVDTPKERSRPVPITRVILLCLGLMTAGGSAVFVFGAAMGVDRAGLSPFAVGLAFSVNALLGIPSARFRGNRRWSGIWVMVTAGFAVVVTTVTVGPVYWAAVALWGFAFWAGTPGIFTLLSDRSANPADRAGDAQSIMAAGRVLGPLVGAALVEAGSFTALGIVAASMMAIAGLTLLMVEARTGPYAAPQQHVADPLTL